MYETRNDLPESARKGLVQLLNERLAEAIDLQKLLWLVEAHVQK